VIHERRLPTDVTKKLPQLIEVFKGFDCVEALFFFGSLIRCELKPLSDLDFAVLLDSTLRGDPLFRCQLDLEVAVSRTLSTDEFDLLILNTAPLRFAHRVLRDGKLIFVRDREQLIDFRERTIKLYLDFSPYRRSFDRAFLEGVGAHG
jgi:uncharacterized protein